MLEKAIVENFSLFTLKMLVVKFEFKELKLKFFFFLNKLNIYLIFLD
jgi:hypothetical protein